MENKTKLIYGETPFQVNKRAFAIGESASGYTLQTSVSGEADTFKTYGNAVIPADTQHDVEGVPAGRWWKLSGNTGNVTLQY